MIPRAGRLALAAALMFPLVAAYAGGWATITVEDLPDHVVAGKPAQLSFTVRQHGARLLGGLEPTVEAKNGKLEVAAAAVRAKPSGRYTASLTLPKEGEWSLTIHSGFGPSKVKLLPLLATSAGSRPRPLAAAERGRRLFVAKGCLTCHVHADVEGSGVVAAGPALTGRRFAADYLARFLADPSIRSEAKMPDLDLQPAEIAALVSFINTQQQALR